MLRAIDKHREAAFFLERAIDAFYEEDLNWRYYFNALVAATRNISFVLQKDLRSHYGKRFDSWWGEQIQTVLSEANFGGIRDLRNILEKEGGPYPLQVLEVELENCIFKVVRVEIDLTRNKGDFKYTKLEFRNSQHELPGIPGETPEQLEGRLREFARQLMRTGMKEFWDNWEASEKKITGFSIPWSNDVYTFEDMLAVFSTYLLAMAQVLQNAKLYFNDLPELIANNCGCKPIDSAKTSDG